MAWKPRISNGQIAIPCAYFRGGTSKGPVFLERDLPRDPSLIERVLLAALDVAHKRQVDGIGGSETLTNKVVIASPSTRSDADVDYRFVQLVPGSEELDFQGSCGNMLSTVGPFAVENRLVTVESPRTAVRIYAVNTDELMTAEICTPNGRLTYQGTQSIAGVSRPSAPVEITYHSPFGKTTGALLPTGAPANEIDGVPVSLVDASGLVVVFHAHSIGMTGYEDKATLDRAIEFADRVEQLRRSAAKLVSIDDPASSFFPKPIMIAAPRSDGSITARDLSPQPHYPANCHAAHSLSGAVGLATACVIEGSIANAIATPQTGPEIVIGIEHPAGTFPIRVNLEPSGSVWRPDSISVTRTCRKLFQGHVYIDQSVLR